MTASMIDYVGDELTLFASAANWKAYLRSALRSHIAGDVAEVGAGLGATSKALAGIEGVRSWTCIEPDPAMAGQLAGEVAAMGCSYPVHCRAGTLSDLPREPSFDTILYIDVLEHIQDDRAEIEAAHLRLRQGGRVVVLCPAWPFLYSPFDKAIGHFRRHTKTSLRRLAGPDMTEITAFYMDSVGMLASMANKVALRQGMPTRSQVRFWDKAIVPLSRLADPILLRSVGKSVVIVWAKD
ncbi:hypothetical protein GCM10009087_25360 [Sphingomonas oligophenolica]|uniref:Class I SAM-dependent methyltransferase n=1 Tax=Sphingomonas oligophenolica TaxID=301154 RepID=A0ABU9Y9J1_9SPHN